MEPLAHASIGLLAKAIAPKASFWALIAATQVPDLFNAAGIENPGASSMDFDQGLKILSLPVYPWSHGLFMCVAWSVVVGAIAFLFSRDRRTSIVSGAMVFISHWALDFSVYSTLPLFFVNSPLVGLGLLKSGPGVVIGIILEIGLVAGGIAIYWVTRRRMTAPAGE